MGSVRYRMPHWQHTQYAISNVGFIRLDQLPQFNCHYWMAVPGASGQLKKAAQRRCCSRE
jgi:hypothetical protein